MILIENNFNRAGGSRIYQHTHTHVNAYNNNACTSKGAHTRAIYTNPIYVRVHTDTLDGAKLNRCRNDHAIGDDVVRA